MQTLNSQDLVREWIKWQKLRHEHPDLFGLRSTGLKDLDTILGGGIELGQLVYIGGGQKSGKTTLLLTMAKSFVEQRQNILWLSAEMNNMQVATMLFSSLTGIERNKIRSIKLEPEDWIELEKIGKSIETYSAHWNYGLSNVGDVDSIMEEVEKAEKSGKPLDAIFIDYIQLLEAPGVKGGRSAEIESISRNLKRRTLNRKKPMAIIAAAQLNRESLRGKLLDANSFLGSGAIERDMDIGMIIHDIIDKETDHPKLHQKEIIVVGSRETAIDTCQVYYNGGTAFLGNDAAAVRFDPAGYWIGEHDETT